MVPLAAERAAVLQVLCVAPMAQYAARLTRFVAEPAAVQQALTAAAIIAVVPARTAVIPAAVQTI